MNKTVVIIAAVIVIGVIVYLLAGNTSNQQYGSNPYVTTQPSQTTTTPTAYPSYPTVSVQSTVATKSYSIDISNFAFNPASLSLKVGDSVTWTNKDSASHTVTSDSGSELGSNALSNGQSYSHTFNTPGTYSYHCTIHPMMTGTISVS